MKSPIYEVSTYRYDGCTKYMVHKSIYDTKCERYVEEKCVAIQGALGFEDALKIYKSTDQ